MQSRMQARARKAEERKAKKEAEAVAKAKAKASGENAPIENGPKDANEAAAPDVPADTAVEMDSEAAEKGEEGAVAEAVKGGDDMDVDGALAALKAMEAEAGKAIAAPNAANSDTGMAEVNLPFSVLAPTSKLPAALGLATQHNSRPSCLHGMQRRLKRSLCMRRPNRRLTQSQV